jgi:PAS domain S-box-containing protein
MKKAGQKAVGVRDKGGNKNLNKPSEIEIQKTIHKLEMHQAKLEMQNEALNLAVENPKKAAQNVDDLHTISPNSVFRFSREGMIIELNNSASDILQFESMGSHPQLFIDSLTESSKSTFKRFISRVFDSKTIETCEVQIKRKDSESLYLLLNGIIQKDHHTCMVNAANTTALKKSEAKYKDLVEKASIAISTSNKKGKIKFFNADFADLFGYSHEEMLSKFQHNFIHEDHLKQVQKFTEDRMAGKFAPDRYEFKAIKKDSSEFWVEMKVSLLIEHQKIIGTRNYIWDITERKNSEFRFRNLFSKMNSGVAILRYEKELDEVFISEMNVAGLKILHKSLKQVIQQSFNYCFPANMPIELRNTILRVYHSGTAEWIPQVEYKSEGLELVLEIRVFPLHDNEIAYEFNDITQKVLAESDLKESYSEIMSLSRRSESVREEERKEIARNLHDDLGQLLTAIKMDISAIKKDLPAKNKRLQQRSESAILIVNQAISSVQRISSELRPPILDNLGLFEAITSHVEDFRKRSNIKTNIKLPKEKVELNHDLQYSIYRIVQEALTNVARHSCASRVNLIIRKNINILEIEIADNGVGILVEAIQSSESLGLVSMWERVTQWQGHFRIWGEKGEGTNIHIHLPLNP